MAISHIDVHNAMVRRIIQRRIRQQTLIEDGKERLALKPDKAYESPSTPITPDQLYVYPFSMGDRSLREGFELKRALTEIYKKDVYERKVSVSLELVVRVTNHERRTKKAKRH